MVFSLSRQETRIVGLLVKGLQYKEIAHNLEVTVQTVKIYCYNARQKTGAKTTAELCAMVASGKVELFPDA